MYPESYSSSSSGALNSLLQTKLREHAIILRELYASLKATNLTHETILMAVRAEKEDLMKEVYAIMTATLGPPPPANKKFIFDYCDKDGKPGRWEGTPIEFYKVCLGDPEFPWCFVDQGYRRTSPPESILLRIHSPSSMTRGTSTTNSTPSIGSGMFGVDDLFSVRHQLWYPRAGAIDHHVRREHRDRRFEGNRCQVDQG